MCGACQYITIITIIIINTDTVGAGAVPEVPLLHPDGGRGGAGVGDPGHRGVLHHLGGGAPPHPRPAPRP